MLHLFNQTSFWHFPLGIEWSLVKMLESSQFWFIHKFGTHTNSTYFGHQIQVLAPLPRAEEFLVAMSEIWVITIKKVSTSFWRRCSGLNSSW